MDLCIQGAYAKINEVKLLPFSLYYFCFKNFYNILKLILMKNYLMW